MGKSTQSGMFAEVGPGAKILLGTDIRSLANTKGLIDPFSNKHLAPCAYDFSAGRKAVVGGEGKEIDLQSSPLTLPPGSYAGVMSLEKVALPPNISVQLGPKRKLYYDGIILLSGSVIDPGYEGHLLFVLYNSSNSKCVIKEGRKICSAIFYQLDRDVEDPVGRDADLSNGNFPDDFLNAMARMEVPSLVQINEKMGELRAFESRLVGLEAKYNDVMTPIKELTKTVDSVTNSVKALAEEGKRVLGKIDEHDTTIKDLRTKVKHYGLLANLLWGLLIAVVAATLAGLLVYMVAK